MVDAGLLNWSIARAFVLLVVLMRVLPLLFLMPVIGSPVVPARIKVFFSLMTALILLPIVQVNQAEIPDTAIGLTVLAGIEVLFAAILAVFARMIFAAVEMAGQMVGIQMGMGMAGVMDPQFGTQISPVGQLWNISAILIFLAIDGHHIFFATLVESYTWVAPGTINLSKATFNGLMQGTAYMFTLAIKIMAPAAAALFFSHVAMGIIAKTVPQIPILIVGLPLNIAVGLVFAGLSMTYFLPIMITNFNMLGRLLPRLGMGMGG